MDDPQSEVHLLPYGKFMCEGQCGSPPQSTNAAIILDYPASFMPTFEQMGSFETFGNPVSVPYVASDGNLEVVFEKAVFYIPPGDPQALKLRSLGMELQIQTGEPAARTPGDGQALFIPVAGDLGFLVPTPFDQFITQHGGYDTFGAPISEPIWLDETYAQQCFTNLCLLYDNSPGDTPQSERVSLATLGNVYAERGYLDPAYRIDSEESVLEVFQVDVFEAAAEISSTQTQTISMVVLNEQDSSPIEGMSAVVHVLYKDGTLENYTMPATDEMGKASVQIPPSPRLENGNIVFYEVCLNLPGQTLCESESYHIWNLP
jgi:hypothetical protein